MTLPSDFKAISLGTIAYVIGYGACLLLGSLFPHEPYSPLWLLSVGLVLLVPFASGAFAARWVQSNAQGHGALVGFLGTAVCLAFLILGVRISIPLLTAAAWLVGAAFLAGLGAYFLERRQLGR
ncbi:hypothetical protein [Luteimonas vadosa]|uniref:DUF3147 family protein n=1 Tax=Luteimonas vadosa TaxID=1165507 RepID=A0ABP9E188_9GAMM